MTKKGFVSLGTLAIALTSSLCLSSCGGNKAEQKSTPTTPVEVQATGLPIALVNMDSVTSQYKFAQEIKEALEKDAAAHQTRLQGKSAAIQKAAADFERRMRINAFVSAEAQQAEQQKLIRMQQEGQALSAELSEKLALKQQSLTKVGDNILYAEGALDITEDFIKYLNEHYNAGEGVQAKTDSTAKK